MIKVLLGSLLIATTALAQNQTPRQAAKNNEATSPMSRTVAATMTSKVPTTSANTKPLPTTTREQKLQSRDNAIPSYRMEKDKGIHKGDNRYSRKKQDKNAMNKKNDQ